MRYVAVIVVVIMFVRIDYLLGLFERAANYMKPAPPEVSETTSGPEIIPVSKDQNLKQTPRENFLSLLEIYRITPDSSIRERAMSIFKDHPAMFSEKLDKGLESNVYRWREHLYNNEPETANFLLDLMSILKGENLVMLKKFWSLWMDINMANFIAAYSRTRDTNCSIATTFGDNIPQDEILNEYYDRYDSLKALLADEKLLPAHRALANNCLLVLQIQISKMDTEASPVPTVSPQTPEATPDPSATPVTPEGGTTP